MEMELSLCLVTSGPISPSCWSRNTTYIKALIAAYANGWARLSRLALSYDGTFLAMLSMALRDDCPGFEAGRCVANPAKRCTYCTGHEESYAYAGAVSVLTAYYKIKDDIKDSGFWGKLRSVCLLPFAVRGYHKARKRYPKLDSIVYEYIQAQSKVEQDPQTGIDAAAEPRLCCVRF